MLQSHLPALGFDPEIVAGVDTLNEGIIGFADERRVVTIKELQRAVAPARDVRAYRALRRALPTQRPLIVHTHQSKAGVLGRMAAIRAGVGPLVHTFHGPSLLELFPKPVASGFLAIERFLARWTATLTADSTALRDELLDRGIGRRRQWRVIHNAVDIARLLEGRTDRGAARRALGLPQHGQVVGTMGRLSDVKNQQLFIEAAVLLSQRRSDVTFAVAGSGELRSELEARGQPRLGERLRFLGHVDDPSLFLSAIDAFVMTSRYEGTPLSVIEAAAMGIPVVAMDVGGVGEVVTDRTGVLFHEPSPRIAADAVGSVLADPVLAARLGAAAAKFASERFDASVLALATAEVYRTALEQAGGGIVNR